MMRPRAVLATAALLALAAGTSAAAAPSGNPVPDGALFLTVSGNDHTPPRGVGLLCPPAPDARHPHAAAACADLAAAGGDLDALPGDPHPCPLVYDPVTATATGRWDGHPVTWRRTFPNACHLEAGTGPVFAF